MRAALFLQRLLLCIVMLSTVMPAFAQQETAAEPVPPLTATIIGPDDARIGRTIILDASASHITGSNVQYAWYINDEPAPISTTVDAIYTPEAAGELRFRLVVRALVNGEPQEDSEEHVINVYRRKVVLLADANVTDVQVAELEQAAASGSTYLSVLRTTVPAMDRGGEDALVGVLTEQGDALLDAQSMILWTDGLPTPGLYALIQGIGIDDRRVEAVHKMTVFIPTVLRLRNIARTTLGPISELQPEGTFVVRPSLLPMLLTSNDDSDFLQKARALPTDEPLLLDASVIRNPWWLGLSHFVNSMLAMGVSSQTILLLLVLPVIATILSFLKQIVGMTTFGLFTPAIIALSFLVLGWGVGMLFLILILTTGYASRALMRRLHILYIPKMAIILGVGSITLLLLVGIGTFFGVMLSADTVFVLLIMSTLVESFLNVKSEQGLWSAILAIGQTIVAALLCILVVQWPPFRAVVVAYPEVILVTILINIVLGRFTGLRITEYFRFREVFKHLAQEE